MAEELAFPGTDVASLRPALPPDQLFAYMYPFGRTPTRTLVPYMDKVFLMAAHKQQSGRRKSRAKGRAAWGSISREQVIDAAARAVREGRSDQVTIRSLAADLGVAPMSLYRHVRDKDDLFDEVTDGLLAEAWKPRSRRDRLAPLDDRSG